MPSNSDEFPASLLGAAFPETPPLREVVADSQRSRLLRSMAVEVVERGYSRVTVAQVAKGAGVSLRAFYQNFTDKEDCFCAAYQLAADVVAAHIESKLRHAAGGDWRSLLRTAIEAYVGIIMAEPAISKVMIVDVHAAGERALRQRDSTLEGLMDVLAFIAKVAAEEDPTRSVPTRTALEILLGGIAELVRRHFRYEELDRLPEHVDDIVQVASIVLAGTPHRVPDPGAAG